MLYVMWKSCLWERGGGGEGEGGSGRERTTENKNPTHWCGEKNIHTFPRILNALKVLGLICFLPSRSCCCCYLERSEMEGSVVWPTVALAKSRCQLCNTSVIFNMFGILWTCCLLTPLLVWICIYIYIFVYICIYLWYIHTYIYIYIQYIYIYYRYRYLWQWFTAILCNIMHYATLYIHIVYSSSWSYSAYIYIYT